MYTSSQTVVEITNEGGRVDYVGPFSSIQGAITWSKKLLDPKLKISYLIMENPQTYKK